MTFVRCWFGLWERVWFLLSLLSLCLGVGFWGQVGSPIAITVMATVGFGIPLAGHYIRILW